MVTKNKGDLYILYCCITQQMVYTNICTLNTQKKGAYGALPIYIPFCKWDIHFAYIFCFVFCFYNL